MSSSISNNDARRRVYLVTGGNSGIGFETIRQLIARNNNKVYMLSRSPERAKAAMSQLGNPTNVEFIEFDAYSYCNDDHEGMTNGKNCVVLPSEDIIDGVLLNAGGFGETLEPSKEKKCASQLAQLNLMAHVALVKNLIQEQKLRKGSRIVAAGSEACLTIPKGDWYKADFQKHLQGTAVNKLLSYGWIKGIVALYWSAFARHHPDMYITTVSPGCVKDGSSFYDQKGMSRIATFGAKIAIWMNGSHSVDKGAKRYLDSLLFEEDSTGQDDDNYDDTISQNGLFLAHRKGYTKDFGNVTENPRWAPFGDHHLQDLVWESVEDLL